MTEITPATSATTAEDETVWDVEPNVSDWYYCAVVDRSDDPDHVDGTTYLDGYAAGAMPSLDDFLDHSRCLHSWVAGMMHVHDEDVADVAAVRPVECEKCERGYAERDAPPLAILEWGVSPTASGKFYPAPPPAETWPQTRDGRTVWACCVSSIGPTCGHLTPPADTPTFYTQSGITITAHIPWKVDLRVSRIESGTGSMIGFADSSNADDGFRWERRNTPRHHVDKAWLDTVDIYTAWNNTKVGEGVITVYRSDDTPTAS